MTQKQRLLKELEKGVEVNPLYSWTNLGIYRLSARICDLRDDGRYITKRMVKVKNQFGEDVKVASYKLEEVVESQDQSAADDMLDAVNRIW